MKGLLITLVLILGFVVAQAQDDDLLDRVIKADLMLKTCANASECTKLDRELQGLIIKSAGRQDVRDYLESSQATYEEVVAINRKKPMLAISEEELFRRQVLAGQKRIIELLQELLGRKQEKQ